MKISKTRLKEIIKEELSRALLEDDTSNPSTEEAPVYEINWTKAERGFSAQIYATKYVFQAATAKDEGGNIVAGPENVEFTRSEGDSREAQSGTSGPRTGKSEGEPLILVTSRGEAERYRQDWLEALKLPSNSTLKVIGPVGVVPGTDDPDLRWSMSPEEARQAFQDLYK